MFFFEDRLTNVKKVKILTLLLLLFNLISFSQEVNQNRKILETKRVSTPPKIDGDLTDEAWKDVQIAKDFYVLRPDNGNPAPKTHQTEVKVVYDDKAIYISANMTAPNPQKIPREFTYRDNFGQADFFLVTINPIDDGQNPFQFVVMSSGSQAEARVSGGNEDFSWNAVWESNAKITATGWTVEMKIPYRALRFPEAKVQSWGFNFHRNVLNNNAQYTWNFIDNTQGIWTQYDGLITGLKDIEPPTRLIFYPYTSGLVDTFDGESESVYNVGMDVKYGITDNMTLDLTLIPDFGQVGFDNVELNLGPFEQVFSEQRQFFIEGTELFNKGGLFFSRRVGDSPIGRSNVSSQLRENESIIDNPSIVKMLNAVKISGRTKKGLGIGFFNAITEKTEATVVDTVSQEQRKIITEPFANYNIMVLDQVFNKNSSVTLINTNVTRDGSFRNGNVTGLLYNVWNKQSTWFISGSYRMSNIVENGELTSGHSFNTRIAKGAGNWQYNLGYQFDDKNFDINDMGVIFRNNRQRISGNLSYRILQPKGAFNRISVNSWFNLDYLHSPAKYTGNSVGINSFFSTRERFSFGLRVNGNIGERYDYFEPRRPIPENRFFTRPARIGFRAFVSSDYRKKFAYDIRLNKNNYINNPRDQYSINISPRYRFSNQFSMVYSFDYNKNYNDQGWVDEIGDDIIFGQRDRKTFENNISARYNFTVNSSLSLNFRHIWTDVRYESLFYTLGSDGYFIDRPGYDVDQDINFNSWNLDLNYIWQFTPGSQLIAFYRNSIFSRNSNTGQTFEDNLTNLFQQPIQNIFSVRLVIFLDYNDAKTIF